jgi:hypothetical protein
MKWLIGKHVHTILFSDVGTGDFLPTQNCVRAALARCHDNVA